MEENPKIFMIERFMKNDFIVVIYYMHYQITEALQQFKLMQAGVKWYFYHCNLITLMVLFVLETLSTLTNVAAK